MEGDVWICMEVMDFSLDKFYAKVYKFGRTIPEQILGPITVAVIMIFINVQKTILYFDIFLRCQFVIWIWILSFLFLRLDFTETSFSKSVHV